jgi:hypothetical protein
MGIYGKAVATMGMPKHRITHSFYWVFVGFNQDEQNDIFD